MIKELNPELFGERVLSQGRFESVSGGSELPLLDVDRQISDLRMQIIPLSEEVHQNRQEIGEIQKSLLLKIEKLQTAMSKLEMSHNGLAQETAHKVSALNAKFVDNTQVMGKMQEMMDRHNQIVKSFEVRMAQLQNLLNQKDAQLVQTQSMLVETKKELARLLAP